MAGMGRQPTIRKWQLWVESCHWLTIDRWNSAGDFETFGEQLGEDYRALDAELEGIAGEEEFVGAFEED